MTTTTKEKTMSVYDLIEKQKILNGDITPEEDSSPATNVAPRRNFAALIEKQRQMIENRWESLEVTLGGETLQVEIGRFSGMEWLALIDAHPAKTPEDRNLGYNTGALPRAYPIHRLKLDGINPDPGLWEEVYDLLDAEDRKSVAAVIWWINEGEPHQRRAESITTPTVSPRETETHE